MSKEVTLPITTRENTGTGNSRASRRAGNVPGVIYGGGQDAIAIEAPLNEVLKAINSGNFISNMVTLDNGGKKQKAITKDLQFHPVSDMPMHIDFYRVKESDIIEVEVPIKLINEATCPGMKRGGALNVVRYAIEIKCPAGAIPEFLEVDLADVDIDDSVHVSAINMPENVSSAITDRDVTILSIVGTRTSKQEGGEGEGGAEGDDVAGEGEAEAESEG